MVDTLWLLGFFIVLLSTSLFLGCSITGSIIAAREIYRWARRGRREEQLDLRDIARMRHDVETIDH
jgi:hypothetical protein